MISQSLCRKNGESERLLRLLLVHCYYTVLLLLLLLLLLLRSRRQPCSRLPVIVSQLGLVSPWCLCRARSPSPAKRREELYGVCCVGLRFLFS